MNRMIGYIIRHMIASLIKEYAISLPEDNLLDVDHKEAVLSVFENFEKWLYFEMTKN